MKNLEILLLPSCILFLNIGRLAVLKFLWFFIGSLTTVEIYSTVGTLINKIISFVPIQYKVFDILKDWAIMKATAYNNIYSSIYYFTKGLTEIRTRVNGIKSRGANRLHYETMFSINKLQFIILNFLIWPRLYFSPRILCIFVLRYWIKY